MNCVPLSHLSAEPCLVSWSEDQRIAVTTNELVYILTLRSPLSLTNTSNGYPAPSTAATKKSLPLFIMSTLLAPSKMQLPKLELGGAEYAPVKKFPPAGNWPFMEMIDPVLQDSSSASSCDLFKSSDWTPPGCCMLGGCLLCCLTKGGRLLLFSPPGMTGCQWTLLMDLSVQHSTHLLSCNFNPDGLTGSPDKDTSEGGSNVKTSSPPYDYVQRKLSLTVTAFAWLPALLKMDLDSKLNNLALVAMATRLGNVVLMGVEVPVVNERGINVMTLQIIDGFTEGKGQHQSWVCSLKWTRRNNTAWLAFGCTDGRVGTLHWSDLSLSLTQPSLSLLWKQNDCIPVHCLAWDHPQHSPDQPHWLAASKGSLIVVFDILSVPRYTVVSGIHSVSVSGICSLSSPNYSFISTSLDGTVQKFQLPHSTKSHVNHVTPKLVTMETIQQSGTQSIHGIAVSKNCLFASIVLDQKQAKGRLKARHRFQLHFLPLVGEDQDVDLSTAFCSWDVVEYLRQLSSEKLVRTGSVLTEPRMVLQQAMLERKDEADIARCKEDLLCQHVSESLKKYVEWSDQLKDGVNDAHSTLSLSMMSHWLSLSSKAGSSSRATNKVPKTVQEKLSLYRIDDEKCAGCGKAMAITSSQEETCQNGHTWKRCGITFTLVMDPQCGSCMQCGAFFNNSRSLSAPLGSWMEKLLEEHTTCVYCGGHFEQVM